MKIFFSFMIIVLLNMPIFLFADQNRRIINCSDLDKASLNTISLYKKQIDLRLKEATKKKNANALYDLGLTAFCLNNHKAGEKFMEQAAQLNFLPAVHFMGNYYLTGKSLNASKKISSTPAHFNKALSYYEDAAKLFTTYIDRYPDYVSDALHDETNMFIFVRLSSLYFTQYTRMAGSDMDIVHYPQMTAALDNMRDTADLCLQHLLFYHKNNVLFDSVNFLAIQQYCFTAASYASQVHSLEKSSQRIVQDGHVLANEKCFVDPYSWAQEVRNGIDDISITVNSWVDIAASTIYSWTNGSVGTKQISNYEQIDKAAKKQYCGIRQKILFHTKDMLRSMKDTYYYMNHFLWNTK